MDWHDRSKKNQKAHLDALAGLYGNAKPVIAIPAKRKPRKLRRNIESQHVKSLVRWLRLNDLPVVKVSNEGKRSCIQGAILKAEGLWAGASDLFIPIMRGGMGGFWLEMKAPGEKPRQNQLDFLSAMRKQGYKADWFSDWEKAKCAIEQYLTLG